MPVHPGRPAGRPLRAGNAEVLEGEAVVESRVPTLQSLEGLQHQLHAQVAGAVNMDVQARLPQDAGCRGELFRWRHPFPVPAIEVAGKLQLEELGEKPSVGEHLHVIAEPQSMGVALG